MQKRSFYSVVFAICILFCTKAGAQSLRYDSLVTQSFDYLEMDSLPQAAEAIKAALRLEPSNQQNGLLLGNLGSIQRTLHQFEDAEQSFSIALGYMPGNKTILANRASLRAEMEHWGSAIDDYSTLLAQDQYNEDIIYELALCRLMSGDTIGARQDLESIHKFNKYSAKARLGMVYVYKTQKQWREASELLDELIKRNPRSPKLYRERAEVYYYSNRLGAAYEDINKSIQYNPHDPYSYIQRALIRKRRGDTEFMNSDLNRARELGMTWPEIRQLVARDN